MANEQNLKPFEKGNTFGKGRPKGSLNRSTIARKWLNTSRVGKNPITGQEEILSQEDVITLAIIRKAIDGDVPAYKALLDSAHGTAKDTIDIKSEHVGIDFDQLMSKLSKNAKS